MRRMSACTSAALLLLLAAGCGDGSDIEVSGAWGRPVPAVAANGAFYMVISNNADTSDQLERVSSAACGAAELHESMMTDGVMSMSPVGAGGIEIRAGSEVVLEAGGLHVMCIDKQVDFVVGETYELTLEFAEAGSVVVDVEIREG
ncbi:MAG TPA: copper chaperone PCu(A)C [Acidimicrobiia bacterium]|nr:copper chaperone PCu(A)C [Acidimicrobiia bacterium]